ncbi:MAG: hypothetical protein M1818_005094 [Claussenomyces sp. TS43310]|nr:MAG: hypothetical protein M1818_005094 [Claussenomyces sp. TS43310]
MAPTEHKILTTFLLPPAPLPQTITLSMFKSLFPRSEQSSPEIKRLYRSIQHQRALLTDAVALNIDAEVRRGKAQQNAVVRSRRAAEKLELDDEVVIENALFGSTSNLPIPQPHTLLSILPAIEAASQDVLLEIQALEEETKALLADVASTVGGLSDLRYGRFANGQAKQEVLAGLDGLKTACHRKSTSRVI